MGFSVPIPEWVIREKLARERGYGRVVDAVRGYAKACRFERDHNAAAEGVEHGNAVGIGLRKLRYQFSVSSVPARHRPPPAGVPVDSRQGQREPVQPAL